MSSRITRTIASGVALGVSALGLSAFAPAQAASAELNFDCTVSILGTKQFKTVADTNLPEQLTVGQKAPIAFTATVTVPQDVANTARAFYGTKVKGTATVKNTVNDKALPDATAAIPETAIAANQPLVLQVSGTAPEYTADTVGTNVVKIASYDAVLTFTKDDGTVSQPLTVPCKAPAGADTTVDTFTVVPAPVQETTTEAAAKYKKKQAKLVAKVQVLNEDESAAAGDVKLVLKKGNKKAGKATVTLNGKGKGKHAFTKITAKGKYTLVAKYKGAEGSKKSKETVVVKIK